MRTDGPSRTALAVAGRRLALTRPSSPTGDPAAEDRLARHLLAGVEGHIGRDDRTGWVAARTKFFDAEVMTAVATPIPQVVIVGAGYDGRALRFRTPGVQFFEIDHPLTQADKRERLGAVSASSADVIFACADFAVDDISEVLEASGHDASRPTLFVCEGVLRYLPEKAIRSLLQRLALRASPGSSLSVSITTREPGSETTEAREDREVRETALAVAGEAVLTVPPRGNALEWLSLAGWRAEASAVHDSGDGRLLIHVAR